MTKWTYGVDVIERRKLDEKLDEWGAAGWELVSFTPAIPESTSAQPMFRVIFKRQDILDDDTM